MNPMRTSLILVASTAVSFVALSAWAEPSALQAAPGQVSASGTVTIGGGVQTAPPPAQPGTVYTQAPPAQQPPPAYAPPPPAYSAPPPPPPAYPPPRRYPVFYPTLELGGKILAVSTGGNIIGTGGDNDPNSLTTNEVHHGGGGFQADIGWHFHPQVSVYGFWEHDWLTRGSRNGTGNDFYGTSFNPYSNALGIGLRWNTAPHHPIGFLLDLAFAGRVTDFATPVGNGAFTHGTASGGEFRIGLGASIGSDPHFRLEPALNFGFGEYNHFGTGDYSCPYGTYDCSYIDVNDRGTYWTAGVSLGAHFDLWR